MPVSPDMESLLGPVLGVGQRSSWPAGGCTVRSVFPVRYFRAAGAVRLPGAPRAVRELEFQQTRFHHRAEVALNQAPLMHRQPAREFLGGGPIAETADVQDQGRALPPARGVAWVSTRDRCLNPFDWVD